MIYRHTDEETQYYFLNDSLNQSSIKILLNDGIQKFIEVKDEIKLSEELYYSEKTHFVIGNAVDYFMSQGKKAFDKKYAYSKLQKKPGEKPMSIINMVFDKVRESITKAQEELRNSGDLTENQTIKISDLISYKKEIYDACDEHQYYMNRKIPSDKPVKVTFTNPYGKKETLIGPDERTWEEDKRWESIVNHDGVAQQYWEELISSIGKQLLSQEEAEIIGFITTSFNCHPHTRHLFEDSKDVDIIHQMPMYFEYDGVMCKILPDVIRVDHSKGKIFHIDNKTMGDYVLKFDKHLRARRYDIQGSFYNYGIHQNLDAISKLIGKDVTGYTIADPAFVVESTTKPGTPMVYVMTDELVRVATIGDGKYIQGWTQGVALYKAWREHEFNLDSRFKSTNGIVWINEGFDYNETF